MDALQRWSLSDLMDRVLRERLVDECILEKEYIIIVQGSTRFVLDHHRAHAFLRGIVRGMSPAFRWSSSRNENGTPNDKPAPSIGQQEGDESGIVDSFRRHIMQKWWGRYEDAGCPFGETVSGVMTWIRYDTRITIN